MNILAKKKILLADNVKTHLETRVSFLKSKGYEVFPASSPEEVERVLDDEHVHLAVLDIRLVDDANEEDFSGIRIAQRLEYAPVPFIMLTGFPHVKGARLALMKYLGRVPAVDYLSKNDGLPALQAAIEAAFGEHIRVNWDLQIDFRGNGMLTLLSLVSAIFREASPRILLNRAAEFEDLLRRVFFSSETLRIERLLWQHSDILALAVIAFQKGKAPEVCVLVAGSRRAAAQEANRFREFEPGPGLGCTTRLIASHESLHFGLNLYQLADVTQDNLATLEEKYTQESGGAFKNLLETLLDNTLAAWHARREVPGDDVSLDALYRRETLHEFDDWQAAFVERLVAIQRHSSALDGHFERSQGQFSLWLGERKITLMDPLQALARGFTLDLAVARVHSPGELRGDNILVQNGNRLWLTDFAAAGLKPYLWNYQSLEAAIRYDWKKSEKLSQILLLEEALVGDKFHGFSKPDYTLLDAELHPPVRAIQAVRRSAAEMRGFREPAYHLGLFYLAIRRILSWQPDASVTGLEISRLAHCLVSAALIAHKLQAWTPVGPERPRLRIHPETMQVYVNGVERTVHGKGLEILLFLYEKPGVVTYEDIVRKIYEYDPAGTDRGLVRKAIQRLRNDIEPDPKEPVFVLTVPGKGYRLDMKTN